MIPESPDAQSIQPIILALAPAREVILEELHKREREGPPGHPFNGIVLSLAEDYGIYPDEFKATL